MGEDHIETEKYSTARGGLDGPKFVESISGLLSDLGRLSAFVEGWNDAIYVAPPPLASVGHEVDRDAVLLDHLDASLTGSMSRVVDLLAMIRVARAALEQGGAK
ncbi:hypothetical protein [Bradyrhizobium zhanjiangense]|uniref:hypothetical protein n=1 Tax=Bradyrhizobium zhanjiangense TaxID=1325107 RepID=UPI001008857C|nr:hypothetical protein [Bradyrhizobium zhanjiangense]